MDLKNFAYVKILSGDEVQPRGEIPMNGGLDKLTVQLGFIIGAYVLTFLVMYGISLFFNPESNMIDTIFGFNFLIGVLMATLVKAVLNYCRKVKIIKRQYLNNFLLERSSNFFFDSGKNDNVSVYCHTNRKNDTCNTW